MQIGLTGSCSFLHGRPLDIVGALKYGLLNNYSVIIKAFLIALGRTFLLGWVVREVICFQYITLNGTTWSTF